MEDEKDPDEANTVLSMQRHDLPETVAHWIFEETSEVLECPPLLSVVSWLASSHHEFCKIAICLLGQCSTPQERQIRKRKGKRYLPAYHVSALIDIGDAIEEGLDACDALSEVGLRVVSIV